MNKIIKFTVLKQAKYYLERYNAERDELVSEIHQLRIDIVGGE